MSPFYHMISWIRIWFDQPILLTRWVLFLKSIENMAKILMKCDPLMGDHPRPKVVAKGQLVGDTGCPLDGFCVCFVSWWCMGDGNRINGYSADLITILWHPNMIISRPLITLIQGNIISNFWDNGILCFHGILRSQWNGLEICHLGLDGLSVFKLILILIKYKIKKINKFSYFLIFF